MAVQPTQVVRSLVLTISCLCILGADSCNQQNNQDNVDLTPESAESSSEARSFASLLAAWEEVEGIAEIEDLDLIKRLYVWAGLLFLEYISDEVVCLGDDVTSPCEKKEVVIKQIAPGQWEERSLTDAYISDESTVDELPDDAPESVSTAIQLTIEERCVIAVASPEGIQFFEDGFGWQEWSDGLSNYEIKDFDYVAEEKILYAATQEGLYRLDLQDIEALAEASQILESERQCVDTGPSVSFGN